MSDGTLKRFCARSFRCGKATRAYEYFGAHRQCGEWVFRVWAPHAESVSVCGDFNGWSTDRMPMRRVGSLGVWELRVGAQCVAERDRYKYFIRNGCRELYKADPYGVLCEDAGESASVICDTEGYCWRDDGWLRCRKQKFVRSEAGKQPINVYELDVGSWKRHADGRCYSYRELAAELVTYVKQMGYTHVLLMPVCEHTLDASSVYHVSGHYAVAARYGAPRDLMAFVDTMHEAGIGVILNWIPTHFSKDAHGLYEFDGQPLYESAQPDRMGNPRWGTRFFDADKGEVQSFLLSNAFFWIEKFHIDGLCIDAPSPMPLSDCDRNGEACRSELCDAHGNFAVGDLFENLNRLLLREYPDVMMIVGGSNARQSTVENGGSKPEPVLRWNTEWQQTALAYLAEDPLFRKHRHASVRACAEAGGFSPMILPLSHDAFWGENQSLLGRVVGDYEQKFSTIRTFMTYTMTHPGKKLTFMGCEIGQFCKWDFDKEVEWQLLEYEMHAKLQLFIAELNHLYLKSSTLWEGDGAADSFSWIDGDDAARSLFSYCRRDAEGRELTVLLNFTPVEHNGYCLPVSHAGAYKECLNSDAVRYGGRDRVNAGVLVAEASDGKETPVLHIRLAPMSAIVLQCVDPDER